MRASGIGVWSFLRIISIFAVASWILALANGVYLAPVSQAAEGSARRVPRLGHR
jgi:lipopolysaccharide export LptBFGC system permease protein LptF